MPIVLITAAANAEAHRLERIITASEVIFADSHEFPKFLNPSRKFIAIPKGNSLSFAHELLTICLNLGIEKVYPLYKDEVIALSEARILFEEYGIMIVIPSVSWLSEHLQEKSGDPAQPIVILENGNITAGKLPVTNAVPEELATGIFTWAEEDKSIKYTLFTAVDVNVR